jgi:sortase (surface protein transpeptidase)
MLRYPARGAVVGGVALIALVLAGCSPSVADTTARPAEATIPASPSPSAPPPPPAFTAVREVARSPVPARLRVPDLGVDAAIGPVGKAADGSVEVPEQADDVGWYDGGARPGEPGPAVLLGHVDTTSGPAVFVRLPQARPGTVIEVVGVDGSVQRFGVDRVQSFPKTRFPTEEVYLPGLEPELRLVTCGGRFDRTTGHYVDNVVVWASPLT